MQRLLYCIYICKPHNSGNIYSKQLYIKQCKNVQIIHQKYILPIQA
ncbi:hypothetical protein HMPREF9346_03219 [Escherichia coli MS 119-7]|nr:hypothetical protein HMPREF9346_03219 [Escherichia coli MS 119-7]